MSVPETETIVAFVVFFFPGFITFWLASKLCGVEIKERTDLEKIVLSSIFSVLSFLVIGVPPEPERVTQAILEAKTLSLAFLVSCGLGVGIFFVVYFYRLIADFLSSKSQAILSTWGRTVRSSEPCSYTLLRHLYRARDKSELLVYTDSRDVYKGRFGGYTTDPFQIVLEATGSSPLMKRRKDGGWEEIDEYIMLFFKEKDISRISIASL